MSETKIKITLKDCWEAAKKALKDAEEALDKDRQEEAAELKRLEEE
jgi:hypothetical protein